MDNIPSFDVLAKLDDKQLQALFGVRDHYVYGLSFAGLAAAGTATSSFTVQADSNFLWQAGVMQADTTGTVTPTPLVSFTITDTSSGRQLMSAAVPLAFNFGAGQLPFLLPTPRFFRAQTQVTMALTNYSTNVTYTNIYVGFVGTKFFKFAQPL